jgi:hypothetical protein
MAGVDMEVLTNGKNGGQINEEAPHDEGRKRHFY